MISVQFSQQRFLASLTKVQYASHALVPYILGKFGKEGAFDAFTDQLYIPPEYTGKMTHTYIDEEKEGYVTDYLGNTAHYDELSSVHLSKQDYRLNISREFSDYLSSIIYL